MQASLALCLSACRNQTCGQLKVTITALGTEGTPIHQPQPSNTTTYLDSTSSAVATSPSAGRRLRADITSVAAPRHATHHQGGTFVGTDAHQGTESMGLSQSSAEPEGDSYSQQAETADPDSSPPTAGGDTALRSNPHTDSPGVLLPLGRDNRDSKLQLRTQLEQLSELSHLMSQRMTSGESGRSDVAGEAVLGRGSARHGPEPANPDSSWVAGNEDGCSDGAVLAQRAQHEPEESLRVLTMGEGPLLPAAKATAAAAVIEPSTGTHLFVPCFTVSRVMLF